ncbi:MAG: hypothetical protein PVH61_35525 [Candidatus Aminicenantes bacterium]|jgi:hypothetical protein
MLINSDLPFLNAPEAPECGSGRNIAWLYPFSPFIMINVDAEESKKFDDLKKLKIFVSINHEITHLLQIYRIFPLNMTLSHLIIDMFDAPMLSQLKGSDCDLFNSIIGGYAPLLEGIAILTLLISNQITQINESIIDSVFDSRNKVYLKGIKKILSTDNLDADSLNKVIKDKKNEIIDTIEHIYYILNTMAQFINYDKIDLKKGIWNLWVDLCKEFLFNALSAVNTFLSFPYAHSGRSDLLDIAKDLEKDSIELWKKKFSFIRQYIVEYKNEEYISNLVLQLNPMDNHGFLIPTIYSGGHYEVLHIKNGEIKALTNNQENSVGAADWFYHLVKFELARSFYENKFLPFACPIYKMTLGAGVKYFCWKCKPSLEHCTSWSFQKKESQLDISFRSKDCDFWQIVDITFKRQFAEIGKATNTAIGGGNKIFYDGSGKIKIGWFLEDVDYSYTEAITWAEIKKIHQKLEANNLICSKWKEMFTNAERDIDIAQIN